MGHLHLPLEEQSAGHQERPGAKDLSAAVGRQPPEELQQESLGLADLAEASCASSHHVADGDVDPQRPDHPAPSAPVRR